MDRAQEILAKIKEIFEYILDWLKSFMPKEEEA